jgi:hypothetical protein
MPHRNINAYQKSITAELESTKNRVRNLIGSANWGEDGTYKEAILRKIIGQYLPSNLSIGTGFIVSNNDHINGRNDLISTQLDLIIYDNHLPTVFKEGDFVIVTDDMVKAVIEVKSKVTNYSLTAKNSLNKIFTKFNELKQFPALTDVNGDNKIFMGLFSFDYTDNFNHDRIREALVASDGYVNHISLGSDKFIRYWNSTEGLRDPLVPDGRCYIKYNLADLSFSYFISNILHVVSSKKPNGRYWFSFPIEGTKETLREGEPIRL